MVVIISCVFLCCFAGWASPVKNGNKCYRFRDLLVTVCFDFPNRQFEDGARLNVPTVATIHSFVLMWKPKYQSKQKIRFWLILRDRLNLKSKEEHRIWLIVSYSCENCIIEREETLSYIYVLQMQLHEEVMGPDRSDPTARTECPCNHKIDLRADK